MDTGDSHRFIIRKFYVRDRNEVIALWKDVFPDDPPWNDPAAVITRKTQKQRDLFLVGLLDKKVIATVLGGYDGFRGWIYHLAVNPQFRSRGFGKKMMEAIESILIKQGCIKINLQVRSGNSAVIKFYRHIGYTTEDHTSMGKRL